MVALCENGATCGYFIGPFGVDDCFVNILKAAVVEENL
jgi:hypothetical protein